MFNKLLHIIYYRSISWSVIIVLGIVLYGFTLGFPFVFDSAVYLKNNPLLSTSGLFRDLLDTDKLLSKYLLQLEYIDYVFSLALRPVAYFTFRFNYLIGGFNPVGYQVVNITIHISNAIMLYELLRCIIRQRVNSPESINNQINIPFFAALLFLVHPLQTESVTLVIQRFTSLGTFFYLAAMLLYLKSKVVENVLPKRWLYISSIMALILGLFTKEIVITLPVALVMVDLILLRRPWRRTLLLLSPHLACMSLIPIRLLFIADKVKEYNIDTTMIVGGAYTRYEYAVTQLRVVLSYIRLFILPYNQNIDHDYPLFRMLLHPEIIISILIWVCILFAGVQLLRRKERSLCTDLAGFSIFWFIISISPSSSVIPLTDLMLEHHTYLPSLAFCTGSTAYLGHLFNDRSQHQRNVAISGLCLVVIVFGVLTVRRNYDYKSGISIYSETVKRSPDKARPNYGLGGAYIGESQFEKGIPYLNKALKLNPDYLGAYLSLGESYRLLNRPQEAVELYTQYLRTHKVERRILMNLAWTYANSGKPVEAIEVMKLLLSITKNEAQMLSFMAELYLRTGNIREAQNYIGQAREADRLDTAVDIADKLNQIEKLMQNSTVKMPARRF